MKRLIVMTFATLMVLSLSPAVLAADEPSFSDVPASHWAFDEIEKAVDSGIVNGYADGTFKPTGTVSNAHFAAMIAREYYVNALEQLGALPEGQANWWYGGIAACNSSDILDGTKVGNQHESTGEWGSEVNVAMNRYDMAQAMYNLLKAQGAAMPSTSEQTAAQDAIGDWENIPSNYRTAVAVCYALGLLNGQSDGTFGGQNNMNRAQACVVIDRLNQYIEDGSVVTDPGADDTTPPADTDVEEPEDNDTIETYNGTLSNGKEITEANVKEILEELKEEYPEGMAWGQEKTYTSPTIGTGRACNAFAYMISDEIFGQFAPLTKHQNFDDIKVGDIVWVKNSDTNYSHLFVITDIEEDICRGVSGNSNSKVEWRGRVRISNFSEPGYSQSVVWTRYPD